MKLLEMLLWGGLCTLYGSVSVKDSAKLCLLVFFNLVEGTVGILLVAHGGDINSLERRIEKRATIPGTSKLSASVKLFWPSSSRNL